MNSYRQDLLPTSKAWPKGTTTSYKSGYFISHVHKQSIFNPTQICAWSTFYGMVEEHAGMQMLTFQKKKNLKIKNSNLWSQ